MNIKITAMDLSNFKGYRSQSIKFDGNTVISGKNGLGKSTIMCAFLWVLADVNEHLVSNPDVYPIGVEEASPKVSIALDIDGKPVQIARILKRAVKKGKNGEADSVSFSSVYEVNTVEYGLRDYKAKLAECGIDTDKVLTLIHPDVFMSEKKDAMRKVLFGMASSKTDLEVANLTEGAEKVRELLANYTLDEIMSMQKSTLRKIAEEYGKTGEILRAKIEGLEASKVVDYELSALELEKNGYLEELASYSKELDKYESDDVKESQARAKIMIFKEEIANLDKTLNAEIKAKKDILEGESKAALASYHGLVAQQKNYEAMVDTIDNQITSLKADFNSCKKLATDCENTQFDDSKAVCPTCGQTYPETKKAEIKAKFEADKAKKINDLKSRMNEVNIRAKKLIEQKAEYQNSINGLKEDTDKAYAEYEKIEAEISNLPKAIDVTATDEYKQIQDKISEAMAEIEEIKKHEVIVSGIRSSMTSAESNIRNVESKISLAKHNEDIDDRIAELREKQIEYEQNKANCEAILYQVDLVSRKKNELLTEEVNNHFSLIKWKFWELYKNGDYKECCKATVNGKELDVSTNAALTVLAKIDIVASLQKFYGQYLPIFIDGAESLDDNTKATLPSSTQLILLSVTNDKELVVK